MATTGPAETREMKDDSGSYGKEKTLIDSDVELYYGMYHVPAHLVVRRPEWFYELESCSYGAEIRPRVSLKYTASDQALQTFGTRYGTPDNWRIVWKFYCDYMIAALSQRWSWECADCVFESLYGLCLVDKKYGPGTTYDACVDALRRAWCASNYGSDFLFNKAVASVLETTRQ
jgi:hypothetical protein